MVTSSILSFRSTKIVAQKSGHVNVFSMYFQIRYSSSVKSSKKWEKSCGAGFWKNRQIHIKNITKTEEKSRCFRRCGTSCKFALGRTICAEKGKSYANMVKGENAYLVCFHRPLVAYTEANPCSKAQFCRKSILTNTLMGYIINIPHEGILSQEESAHGLLQSSV